MCARPNPTDYSNYQERWELSSHQRQLAIVDSFLISYSRLLKSRDTVNMVEGEIGKGRQDGGLKKG